MGKSKGNDPLKGWVVFSGVAIQMGVIIFLFVRGGQWLDVNYNDSGKLFTVLGTLLGVALSMFLVVRQTKRMNL
jgi:hypothetical protein